MPKVQHIGAPNLDALHAQLRASVDKLPSVRVEPVMNKPWKRREFQVRLPDGDWLAFGQPVA